MVNHFSIAAFVAIYTVAVFGNGDCVLLSPQPDIQFSKVPPNRLDFINTKGGALECKVAATVNDDINNSPLPRVNWTHVDGSLVNEIPGLRDLSNDGTVLTFRPFGPEKYRPDVHSTMLRCFAFSGAGAIRSADVHVRGVVLQNYDVQVYDTYAIEGNAAVFKCHVPAVLAEYVKVVAWIKNDNLQIQSMIGDVTSGGDKFAMMPSGELIVRNVQISESGSKYKCKTVHEMTGDTKMSSNAGQLFVTAPHGSVSPQIVDKFNLVDVILNSKAVLPCVTQGTPAPTVKWFKKLPNVHEIMPVNLYSRIVQSKNDLVINGVQLVDSGTYTCEATNNMGKHQMDVTLTITEPLVVEIVPIVQTAKLHERVTLNCRVVTGYPVTSVVWLHDGVVVHDKKISKIDGNHVLTIDNVQMSDRGMYQCIVKNSKQAVQALSQLRLSEIPPYFEEVFEEVIVHPMNDVQLKCSASGIPLPKIVWFMDGVELKSNDPKLHMDVTIISNVDDKGRMVSIAQLKKLSVEDGGFYSCVASNEAGEKEHIKRINVHGALGSRKNIINKLGISGSNILLNCPVYGYPITKVVWKKDDGILPFDINQIPLKNGTLKVNNIGKTIDSGLYECVASNDLGQSAEGKVSVEVMVKPKIVPFEFQEDLLREGMRARLQCVVSDGDTPLNITWLKDGRPLPPKLGVIVRVLDDFSSILTIGTITPSHNGRYVCVVSNRAATVTHTAELSVNVPPKIIPFAFLDDQFYKGMRAHVTCAISQGDLPVTFYWSKDGQDVARVSGVISRKYDDQTDSLSIENVSTGHSGNYSCSVRNRAGISEWTAQLSVRVPPKLVPFSFQNDHLVEGLLARVSCVVSRGDLPLAIHWEKDGNKIDATSSKFGSIQIKSFDEHSSILSIASVSYEDNGVYSCVATNGAGTARHSAQLVANVPPRWITKPVNVATTKGDSVMIDCQANGFPKPNITWKQANDKSDPELRKDVTNENIRILPNGSLSIHNVDAVDAGFYFCQASNGIGRGLSAVIELKINAPPIFKPISQNKFEASVGGRAELQCFVLGDTPITIVWFKGEKIIQDEQSRRKIQTTNTASDALSVLTIQSVTKSDQGTYKCLAENKHGSNTTQLELTVKGIPDPPTDVRVMSTSSKTVEILWKTPNSANEDIKRYIIQFKEEQESWDDAVSMETVNGKPTNSIVSHLHPATSYMFRLLAENNQGRSLPSQILRAMTNEDAPSTPALDVRVESVNTETIKVTWKAPEEKHWNGKLLGFYVGYKEVDTVDPFTYKTLLTADPGAALNTVQIGGLKQFTKYAVIVEAYNGQGKGPQSEPVIVMTSEGAPSLAPTDIHCTTLTSQSIHVTWSAPAPDSINGILRGYKVLYKPASDWFDDVAENHNITLSTSLTLNQLDKFSNYSIQVLATTRAGDGPKTGLVFCKTLDDLPGPPVSIKAIATSDDSVIVAWKQPENPNGVIRSFSIYWKGNTDEKNVATRTIPANDNNYEVTGLQKGRAYEFWMTATTMAGEGSKSNRVTQSPSGPTVPAKVVSFDEKIIIPWKSDISLRCQSVGLPEPQRKWTLRDHMISGLGKVSFSEDGTLSLKDIQEDDAGDYVCEVHNDFGKDRVTYSIIVLAPPSSPILELVSLSSNAIEVQWKTPASKMSRIKGYKLHSRREVGEGNDITLGADVRSYKLNSLECGTKYEIHISAFNKIGIGAASEILAIYTNGSVPTPPSEVDLLEVTSTSVSLYLNTWKSNGCPIHYFVVEYAQKSLNDWALVSNSIKLEQRRFPISGLKIGTWYELRMTAHNSAGSSVAEYTFATLGANGATIPPEMMSDASADSVESLITYLNFYVIVPLTFTAVILMIIMAVACFYVKTRDRGHEHITPQDIQRLSTASGAQLKRGNSSESFSYMQRGTMNRNTGHSTHADDLSPYATFQLANQMRPDTIDRRGIAPPLPPPRMEGMTGAGSIPINTQFFAMAPGSNFIPNNEGMSATETTFIFPNMVNEHGHPGQFVPGYPQDALKMRFN